MAAWNVITPLIIQQPYYHTVSRNLANSLQRYASFVNWTQAGQPSISIEIRQEIMFRAVYYEVQPTVQEAIDLFDSNTTTDAMRAIYWAGVYYGGYEQYNKVLQLYLSNPSTDLFYGLCATRSIDLCAQTIDLIDKSTTLSNKSKKSNINSMLYFNPNCKNLAWNWFDRNYKLSFFNYDVTDLLAGVASFPMDMLLLRSLFDSSSVFDVNYQRSILGSVQGNLDFVNKGLND